MTRPDQSPRNADDNDNLSRAEHLLAGCLEEGAENPEERLDEICREHPDLEQDLRSLFSRLHSMGFAMGVRESGFPERSGDFKLLHRLGGGGMGVVYLAEQTSLNRQVALKLIRPDQLYFPGTRERFRREVEAIARLSHPGIVPVYSTGEEGGIPFLAMEYVEGRSLAELMRSLSERNASSLQGVDFQTGDEDKAGKTSWQQACILAIMQVAEALEYAHGQGIIHRDIKPSNIMLTKDGRALLLDFGLAVQHDSPRLTRSGVLTGSLGYMSPEQIKGDRAFIDERTDVYSLGVTLYELLTLRLPYHGESGEHTKKLIMAGSAAPIRRNNHTVIWEAEAVCAKAMSAPLKDRYASVLEFRRDLENVLELRPIEAKRRGHLFRMKRWAQRSPIASSFMLFFLLSSLCMAGLFLRAESAVEQGERDLAVARETVRVLKNILSSPDDGYMRGLHGSDTKVVDVLDVTARELDDSFDGMDEIEAAVRQVLGGTYKSLGIPGQARVQLEKAIQIYTDLEQSETREALATWNLLLESERLAGNFDRAVAIGQDILTRAKKEFGARDDLSLSIQNNLVWAYQKNNKLQLAYDLAQEAWDYCAREFGEKDARSLEALNNLAILSKQRRDPELAVKLLRKCCRLGKGLPPQKIKNLLVYKANLGSILFGLKRYKECEGLMRGIATTRTKLLGSTHPHTLGSKEGLAMVLLRLNRMKEAQSLFEEVLDAHKSRKGGELDAAYTASNLAVLHEKAGHLDAAISYHADSLSIRREHLKAGHRAITVSTSNLARLYLLRNMASKALPHAIVGLENATLAHGATSMRTHGVRLLVSSCYIALGRYKDAEPLLTANKKILDANKGSKIEPMARRVLLKQFVRFYKHVEDRPRLEQAQRELLYLDTQVNKHPTK